MTLLSIRDLVVHFGDTVAVGGVSFDLAAGECFAVVGESGSGKSQLCLAAFGLSQAQPTGSVRFEGQELVGADEALLRCLRGSRVSFVFQQPLSALTPHLTIGQQLAEALGERAPRKRLAGLLDEVRLTRPLDRLDQYPHELSGGMRQRVMIAQAIARRPALLIADEPTTALDVAVQRDILDLLDEIRRTHGMAMILVSHDLGLVADRADRVMVMRRGRAVEWGPTERVLGSPRGYYTRTLIAASPRLDTAVSERPPTGDMLLEAEGVTVDFRLPGGLFRRPVQRAVDCVSLFLREGEALGLVGGSGSGKSTLARAIARLGPMSEGEVRWRGRPLPPRDVLPRADRRGFQILLQDPVDSLNPRMRIADSIAEPLRTLRPDIHPSRYGRMVTDAMREVELDPTLWNRFPRELSGGQNQRVGIARALIADPDLLICDEATSALDVSVQAQVVALLERLQHRRRLALLFISHDLALVRRLCHRVMVLEAGRVVEEGPTEAVIAQPQSDHMRRLIAAVPERQRRL